MKKRREKSVKISSEVHEILRKLSFEQRKPIAQIIEEKFKK